MPDTATLASSCHKCGAMISREGPDKVCAACLLEAALVDDDPLATTPVLMDFGDYELLEELGRGGQGVVYRARQKGLNRIVALKIIALGHWATEAHLKRFRLEAEAAAQLDHPEIVPIYEIGERDGACFFSMKFIEGGQLDELVRSAPPSSSGGEQNPLSIREAAALLAKIARTVHYAHENGVLHRDIKPGNILLDRNGEPHLTDFGLARLVEKESNVTRTMDVLGTPSYMAPEQAADRNESLTRATDVYGLGAVLYHLLTRQPPFAGGTTYETIRLVLETEPRSPRLWNPKVDRDVATICLKCLEKDPMRRYASALALAEDLERWLRHEPVLARRTGMVTRSYKWVRRNRAFAAASVAAVVLAAAVGLLLWKSTAAPDLVPGVAVLPFESFGAEHDYFAGGIQDQILTDLAKIGGLRVISRTSVLPFAGKRETARTIGKALGVTSVLEGSVQRLDNRIRISVQLIDTRTEAHLWAETYERDINNLFALQGDLALQIASTLHAQLSPAEKARLEHRPTLNAAAYLTYLQAQDAYWIAQSQDEIAQLVQLYQKAVDLDPSFALAVAKLSYVEALKYYNRPAPGLLEKARADANEALRLQPDLPEAHFALGYLCLWGDHDYPRALAEFEIAKAGSPNDAEVISAIANTQRRQGNWTDSTSNYEKAALLNPKDVTIWSMGLGGNYWALRDYSNARKVFDRGIAVDPNFFFSRLCRARLEIEANGDLTAMEQLVANSSQYPDADGWVTFARYELNVLKRRYGEAIASLDQSTTDPVEGWRTASGAEYPISFLRALAYRFANDTGNAQRFFEEAQSVQESRVHDNPTVGPAHAVLGRIYAGLNRRDDAVREAQRALELLPESGDALHGPYVTEAAAEIYAMLGDAEAALPLLEHSLSTPAGLTASFLKLDPIWDPIRIDPRFQKLLSR